MSIRDNKVDTLSTQNTNMKGRRVIGAAASKDPTDYVIKQEVLDAVAVINQYIKDTADQLGSTVIGGVFNLTTINQISKVTVKGVLGLSSLNDDGTRVSGTKPLTIDVGAAPAASQINLTANGLGALQALCYSADNEQILFDCYWVGAPTNAIYATHATCTRIVKQGGKLLCYIASGQTAGTAIGTTGTGWLLPSILNLTTGNWGFGGNITPGYPIDVTGDVNVSGVFRIGGVPVAAPGPTTQTVVTGSRVLGTVYHNTGTTPKYCSVTVRSTAGGGANFGEASAYTDSAATPTTIVGSTFNGSATITTDQQLNFWVLPGNYYKVAVVTTTVTLSVWTEWN